MMLLQLIKVILNLSSIKLISAAAANGILEDATIAVPLKYLSNFLYNCKVELKLKWAKYCILEKITTGQGEDYTSGCLINYQYIKNH